MPEPAGRRADAGLPGWTSPTPGTAWATRTTLLGEYRQAITCYQRPLALAREFADLTRQVVVLAHLGDARRASGDEPAARQEWRRALTACRNLERRGSLLSDLDRDGIQAKLAAPAEGGHVAGQDGVPVDR